MGWVTLFDVDFAVRPKSVLVPDARLLPDGSGRRSCYKGGGAPGCLFTKTHVYEGVLGPHVWQQLPGDVRPE